VDRTRLLAELRRIRRRGYALNNQELVIGICGVAAAVFGVSGRPVAAINISLTRIPEREEIESKLGPAVMETARAVSELATQLAVDVAAPPRLLRQGARGRTSPRRRRLYASQARASNSRLCSISRREKARTHAL